MRSSRFALRCWTIGSICFVSALQAQPTAPRYDPATYEHTSADIAMRDGVKLHVEVFYPRGAKEPLPFLFERTPYGVGESGQRIASSYKELAEDGYIFVFEDIRGRYKSEGTFVMQRAPKPVDAPGQAIDETTDTNDSIDWMLAQVSNNNGRVGDAWASAMTAGPRRWECSAATRRCER
jgi:predicted acyl esterase